MLVTEEPGQDKINYIGFVLCYIKYICNKQLGLGKLTKMLWAGCWKSQYQSKGKGSHNLIGHRGSYSNTRTLLDLGHSI